MSTHMGVSSILVIGHLDILLVITYTETIDIGMLLVNMSVPTRFKKRKKKWPVSISIPIKADRCCYSIYWTMLRLHEDHT